jgi:hypothetical protein
MVALLFRGRQQHGCEQKVTGRVEMTGAQFISNKLEFTDVHCVSFLSVNIIRNDKTK